MGPDSVAVIVATFGAPHWSELAALRAGPSAEAEHPAELIFGVRANVWGAVFAIVLGLIILFVQANRHPGKEPGIYKPGKEWQGQSDVDSESLYFVVDEEPENNETGTTSSRKATSN
jgi:hypothetical protein